MATPRPGRAVRGSRTGRPIMALLDLLGRRWMLRIGWELRDGAVTFNELQRRCDMVSPSVLHQRLKDGVESGLFERTPDSAYRFTREGAALMEVLQPLDVWAKRWARRQQRKR